MNLMKYGDRFHCELATKVTLPPEGAVIYWRKDAYIRSVMAVPQGLVPLYEYDRAVHAAHLPGSKDVYSARGHGAFAVSAQVAARLLLGEIDSLENVLSQADYWASEARRFAKIRSGVMRGVEQDDFRVVPYHWYQLGPREWMAAATVGIAVEYLDGKRDEPKWKWCTPERALELAGEPLTAVDYRQQLQDAYRTIADWFSQRPSEGAVDG